LKLERCDGKVGSLTPRVYKSSDVIEKLKV
jgi:hypothetical protein